MKIWIGYWTNDTSKNLMKINTFEKVGKLIEISGQDSHGNFNMTGGIDEDIFEAFQYYSENKIFSYKGLFDQENCNICGMWASFENPNSLGYFELRQIDVNLVKIYKLCNELYFAFMIYLCL